MEGRPKHMMMAAAAKVMAAFAPSIPRDNRPHGIVPGQRVLHSGNNRAHAVGADKGSPQAKRASKRGGNPARQS